MKAQRDHKSFIIYSVAFATIFSVVFCLVFYVFFGNPLNRFNNRQSLNDLEDKSQVVQNAKAIQGLGRARMEAINSLKDKMRREVEAAEKKRARQTSSELNIFKRERACLLSLDSDPQVADIYIDGEHRGQTPTAAVVECNSSLNVELRRDGFETTVKIKKVEEQEEKLFLTMRKIPTGSIFVTSSHSAIIYVDGIKFDSMSGGDTKQLKLPANRKYSIEFKNEALNLKQTKIYFVKPNSRIDDRVNMDN